MALSDNLISYWELEEASGTRADSVITSGNDLTDGNTVTQTAGKVGNCAVFTAANSEYLSRADNLSLSTGDIDFTIVSWLYLNSAAVGAAQLALSKYVSAGDQREFSLGYNWTTSQRFSFAITSEGTVGTFLAVAAENFGLPIAATWYFVVVWHDSVGNSINIQVNNGIPDSVSWSNGIFNSTAPFELGRLGNATDYWDGRIDQVGFWKRVLTSDELTTLYNGGAGYSYANIVGRRWILGTH